MEPRYPDVEVALTGEDGNAFTILGNVNAALRRADVSASERKEFWEEATSGGGGGYNELLATCERWVSVT